MFEMNKNNHQTIKSFEKVIRANQGLVFSIAFGITGNAHDAWDITQEVFLKAYQCEDFLSESFKQKAWLAKVTRNDSLKIRRSIRSRLNYLMRFCGFEGSTDATELEANLVKNEQIAQLNDLLQNLSDDERQIVTLRFTAELSYQEIADVMEIKTGTVMSRLSRIKEKLGTSFTEEE